jgi:hypothetical protein
MGATIPQIPGLNVITQSPTSGHVLTAEMYYAATLPTGATYSGIFAADANLIVQTGAAAGNYINSGSLTSPAWTASVVGLQGPTGPTGPSGPTGPTGPTGHS